MENSTMCMILLVGVLISIPYCTADTCYCRCCSDSFCTSTAQDSYTVSSCTSASCKALCQAKYPAQCTNGVISSTYTCASGNPSTADWVGVFGMANMCDTTTCCCPTGQLTLSRAGTDSIRAQCPFAGQCSVEASYLNRTFSMPIGFSTIVVLSSSPILVTLSADSRTIQMQNTMAPTCTQTATRNVAIPTTTRSGSASSATIHLASVSLLVGLISLKLFMI